MLNVTQNASAIPATLAQAIRELLAATPPLALDITSNNDVAEKYTLARMNAREALRCSGF